MFFHSPEYPEATYRRPIATFVGLFMSQATFIQSKLLLTYEMQLDDSQLNCSIMLSSAEYPTSPSCSSATKRPEKITTFGSEWRNQTPKA